jgi:hypothetical protein
MMSCWSKGFYYNLYMSQFRRELTETGSQQGEMGE